MHECNRFDSGCYCFRISIISPFSDSGCLLCRRPNFRPRAFRRRSARRGGGGRGLGKVAPPVCYARRSLTVNALKLHAFRIQGRNSRETAARCCSPNYTESLSLDEKLRNQIRRRKKGGKWKAVSRYSGRVSWIRKIYFNPTVLLWIESDRDNAGYKLYFFIICLLTMKLVICWS